MHEPCIAQYLDSWGGNKIDSISILNESQEYTRMVMHMSHVWHSTLIAWVAATTAIFSMSESPLIAAT